MPMPLEGIRVLDMTLFQQGPVATKWLADLGADVIKLEHPEGGDPGRNMVSSMGLVMGIDDVPNYYFEAHNRNKRGIAIDLGKDAGRRLIYQLILQCDAFVSNFLPATLDNLGMSYKALSEINPRLVYAVAGGYGPFGPERDRRGLDLAAQAVSGMMSIVAEKGHYPLDTGVGTADQNGGVVLALGVLAALLSRHQTGKGQRVDTSLLGSSIALHAMWLQCFLLSGQLPHKVHRTEMPNPFYNVYQAGDGKWFVLSMGRATLAMGKIDVWPYVCRVTGLDHLASDPRFDTAEKLLSSGKALVPILDEAFLGRSRDEWVRLLEEGGVICSPINSFAEVANDPQAIANDYVVEIDDPLRGIVKQVGIPIHFSETPAVVRSMAPELGRHTEEVLLELAGCTWDDIVSLKEAGVIL